MPDWNRQLTRGIVGTRQASAYAVQGCDIMAKGVAGAGALVVSGGALGSDSTAHKGAMLAAAQHRNGGAAGQHSALMGGTVAVSYTHLDVYKRQALHHLRGNGGGGGADGLMAVLNIALGLKIPGLLGQVLLAVSLCNKGVAGSPRLLRDTQGVRTHVSDQTQCAVTDRKSTRLNSSHSDRSRMPSSA